jgi:hypothetical protein
MDSSWDVLPFLGWTWSVVYSSGIGTLLKVISGALQQKIFGEKFSHKVQVRQFVGINSTPMKALRLVVGKNGLSVPKAAILMGGPDWPVSAIISMLFIFLFHPRPISLNILNKHHTGRLRSYVG